MLGSGMERISDWILNSHVQSLFLSPLIGAIMGMVLSWIFSPPARKVQNTALPSAAYYDRRQFYRTEIHHHHYREGTDQKGEAFLVICFILPIILAWAYIHYSLIAILVISSLAWALFFFSLSYIIIGYSFGWLNGAGWIYRLSRPLIICVIILMLLKEAQGYAAYYHEHSAGVTMSDIIKNFNHQYVAFTAFQALGILSIMIALLLLFVMNVHYTALGGLVRQDQTVRVAIVHNTEFASTWLSFLGVALLLGLAWGLITGKVYSLLHS